MFSYHCPSCHHNFKAIFKGLVCPECGPGHKLVKGKSPNPPKDDESDQKFRQGYSPLLSEDDLVDESGADAVRDWMADTYHNEMGEYYRRLGYGKKGNRKPSQGEQSKT